MKMPYFYARGAYEPPAPPEGSDLRLSKSLNDNLLNLHKQSGGSDDLVVREFNLKGLRLCLLHSEGLTSSLTMSEFLIRPLFAADLGSLPTPEGFGVFMREKAIFAADQQEIGSFGELFLFVMSGFAVLLCDGISTGYAMGLQGFDYRSVGEPLGEFNVRGSRESFTEALRVNMGMVRRRMKTPLLKMELGTVGENSRTDFCLIYRTDKVDSATLNQIKHRLGSIKLDTVLESGYLQPFLENKKASFFSTVGTTERPDTLCAKLSEGRVAILVDGTPFALTLPHLFGEYFQGFDDYTLPPYYVTMIRLLRYISFVLTITLPGLYVAIARYHLELLPPALLYNIAAAEEKIPFSSMLEVLIITLIYEVVREAGLRMPQPVGMAVSIVGALVVGDAAVKAGIIGAPMVMVVALTAVSAFLVPALYQAITFLRLMFIIAGGFFGLFGITAVLLLVGANLFALESMGIPLTTPIAPIAPYAWRDLITRAGWPKLSKEQLNVQQLQQKGSPDQNKQRQED